MNRILRPVYVDAENFSGMLLEALLRQGFLPLGPGNVVFPAEESHQLSLLAVCGSALFANGVVPDWAKKIVKENNIHVSSLTRS